MSDVMNFVPWIHREVEAGLRGRVVGQDRALSSILAVLGRRGGSVGSSSLPIARFLFMGRAGVGKTSTALAISELMFRRPNPSTAQVRLSPTLDARAFRDQLVRSLDSITQPDGQPSGVLILDEVDKARPDATNSIGRMLGDGRIQVDDGRIIDLRSAIVILMADAPESTRQERSGGYASWGWKPEPIGPSALKTDPVAMKWFDSVDEVVLFDDLRDKPSHSKLLESELSELRGRLDGLGIRLALKAGTEDILSRAIARAPGWDLRTHLQDQLLNPISEGLLMGRVRRGDTIVVGWADGPDREGLSFSIGEG